MILKGPRTQIVRFQCPNTMILMVFGTYSPNIRVLGPGRKKRIQDEGFIEFLGLGPSFDGRLGFNNGALEDIVSHRAPSSLDKGF